MLLSVPQRDLSGPKGVKNLALPKKVAERLAGGLKRFQPVLASAKSRDVNESDTVIIVTDVLAEVFGYDKYSEITSEHAIRGTYCDLAIRLDGTLALLLEVKSIGLELKDQFVKQAVDYAANQGTDWVVLTNAEVWRIYRVTFGKPIEHELVLEFNISTLSAKSEADLETLYHLSSEGWRKSALHGFHEQRQALSRFFIAALITTDPVVDVLRRELRRLAPDVRIEADQIREVLTQEVLKRDAIEGEKAEAARKRVAKAANRVLRVRGSKPNEAAAAGGPAEPEAEPQLDESAEPTSPATA